jgi:hypothetical protein
LSRQTTHIGFGLTLGLATLLALNAPAGGAESLLGFAYEPYVGQWQDNAYWDRQNPLSRYSTAAWGDTYKGGNWSVARQIDLLAPYTSRLATYSAGVFPWNGQPASNLEDNALVAPALAARNKSTGSTITLYQGIYQQVMNGTLGAWNGNALMPNSVMAAEVNEAVQLSNAANATSPGTVVGLVFTNEYATDVNTTKDISGLIQWYKTQYPTATLPIAVRAQTWGQVKNTGAYADQLKALIGRIDVVMANIYPSADTVRQCIAVGNAQTAVDNVTGTFNDWKMAVLAANPTVKVVLSETGWPVAGVWYDDAQGKVEGSATLAGDFFDKIRAWADAQGVEVYYFEAISEPYKSNKNWTPQDGPWPSFPGSPPPPQQRADGAEGHFGAWHYGTADASGSFVADVSVSTISETPQEPLGSPLGIACPLSGFSMLAVTLLAGCWAGRRGRRM